MREEGQVSCLDSLPFPFEGHGAKRAKRWTGVGERSSDFLPPLFFASYSAHPTAELGPRLHFSFGSLSNNDGNGYKNVT